MGFEYSTEYLFKIGFTLVYFLGLIGIGVVTSYFIKDIEDYFVAGKNLGYWLVSFSSRATGESGWLLLGLTGTGFLLGMHAYWVTLGEVIGVLIAWVFMVQRFKVFTDLYDSITIPDYLEDRFNDATHIVRVVSALVLSVFVTMYVSGQFLAAGKAFQGFLGIDVGPGIVIGMAIVIIYSVAGGFLAVAWSDLIQGIMMFLGLTLVPVVAVYSLGGVGNLVAAVRQLDPVLLTVMGDEPTVWMQFFSILGLVAIGWGFMGSPQLFVRFIAVKNNRELVDGSLVAVLFTILTDAGAVTSGICGRVLYESRDWMGMVYGVLDEEMVYPMMVDDLLPLTLSALFLAVVLAAIMSTADSLLVVASSSVVRDIYQQIFRPDASQRWLTFLSRMVTLVLSLLALWFTLAYGTADLEYDARKRPLTQLSSATEVDASLLDRDDVLDHFVPGVREGLSELTTNLLSEAKLIRSEQRALLDKLGEDPFQDLRQPLLNREPGQPAFQRSKRLLIGQLQSYKEAVEQVSRYHDEDRWSEEINEYLETAQQENNNWAQWFGLFDEFHSEYQTWIQEHREEILAQHAEAMVDVMSRVESTQKQLEEFEFSVRDGDITAESDRFAQFRTRLSELSNQAEDLYSPDLLVYEGTPPVFWFILIGWAGIASAFCPLIMLSLFWSGVTRWGAVAGIVSALIVVPFWVFAPIEWLYVVPGVESFLQYIQVDFTRVTSPSDVLFEMVPGFLVSFIAIFLVSFLTEPPDNAEEDLETVRDRDLDVWEQNQ